jgi:pyridoxal phosphate enzyme (YggS family)
LTVNIKIFNEITSLLSNYKNSKLLVVSKNRSREDIERLMIDGANLFGENRVQEAKSKFTSELYEKYNYELHLIGPLQSNKTEDALKIFDTIQTIDRRKLVDTISKLKNKIQFKTKSFYIQINIGEEEQKSGIKLKELNNLYNYSLEKNLNIVGLMCIPPLNSDVNFYFNKMLETKDKLNNKLLLSMGMSNDYETALKCGSNMIRIGSKIFK